MRAVLPLFWMLAACTGSTAPTDRPRQTEDTDAEPAPSLTWTAHRDVEGRFSVDVPSELRSQPRREVIADHRELRLYPAMAELDEPPVEVEIAWALLPDVPSLPLEDTDTDDTDVPALAVPSDAPPEALLPVLAAALGAKQPTSIELGGRPALRWSGHNFTKQWSGGVVLGEDRFIVLRVRNKGQERLDEAHDRVFSSFTVLPAASLTEEERAAGQERVAADEAHEAALARAAAANEEIAREKAAAIARGERPPDAVLIEQAVQRQSGRIRCFDLDGRGSRNLNVRVRVQGGQGQATNITESPFSFSNNQPRPKPVTDSVAGCIKRAVRSMSFPSGVEGAADMTIVLGPGGF